MSPDIAHAAPPDLATLATLTTEAMALRSRFDATALASGRRTWTRDEVMSGFVGDVGDLMKLVMAKNGVRPIADIDRKLGHELADCLWSVLVLAKLHDVDLEREFTRMIAEAAAQLPLNTPPSTSSA
jgi:NTP pyrophosphatase (non-canonical NTP hydrolase)